MHNMLFCNRFLAPQIPNPFTSAFAATEAMFWCNFPTHSAYLKLYICVYVHCTIPVSIHGLLISTFPPSIKHLAKHQDKKFGNHILSSQTFTKKKHFPEE